MATIKSANNASSQIAGKERQIKAVTELLEKLKEDKPTSQSELMALVESINEINKPTKDTAIKLFEAIEMKFPHKTLGEDKWYLVVVSVQWLESTNKTDTYQLSALVGVDPEYAGNLYVFLINKPEYKTSESRKALIRRLREALVKNVSTIGVCKPLEALFAIEALERSEDQDLSCSRSVVM